MSDADVNALLDSLDDDDEGNEDLEPKSNKVIQDIRRAYRKLEKDHKALLAETEELRTFKSERVIAERNEQVGAAFKEVGLNEKHAKLWAALNPDTEVSSKAVAEWAVEYGLAEEGSLQAPAGEEPPATDAPSFRPTTGASPVAAQMSPAELKDLYARDPQAALAAIQRGKVSKERPRFYGEA